MFVGYGRVIVPGLEARTILERNTRRVLAHTRNLVPSRNYSVPGKPGIRLFDRANERVYNANRVSGFPPSHEPPPD